MSGAGLRRAAASCAVGAALAACGPAARPPSQPGTPARVVAPSGTDLGQIVLEPGADTKLGLKTEPIRDATIIGSDNDVDAPPRVLVPLSAVIYDIDGSTSVFVRTDPRTYVRERVTVVDISGENAVLSSGLPLGAAVVTVGGVELLGAQKGVPGEQ